MKYIKILSYIIFLIIGIVYVLDIIGVTKIKNVQTSSDKIKTFVVNQNYSYIFTNKFKIEKDIQDNFNFFESIFVKKNNNLSLTVVVKEKVPFAKINSSTGSKNLFLDINGFSYKYFGNQDLQIPSFYIVSPLQNNFYIKKENLAFIKKLNQYPNLDIEYINQNIAIIMLKNYPPIYFEPYEEVNIKSVDIINKFLLKNNQDVDSIYLLKDKILLNKNNLLQ